jgi:hypothetical protein
MAVKPTKKGKVLLCAKAVIFLSASVSSIITEQRIPIEH